MADHDINILIRAKDLASKQIGTVTTKLGKLDSVGSRTAQHLKTGLIRVGTVGAVSLVGGIALGARSLGHLERVANQTNAVLESTGHVSGQTAESIREQAEALEQLTTADDKAIQEGQNMLLTFTKIGGETFPQATEAVTNMAIAMASGDVANADFVGSAKQIGKALQDPIRGLTALRKSGVSFTREQEKQVKALVESGDLLGAQAIILKELETEFGNAGKAAGTGFEADMRRVEDAGEDVTQALARGVMPALSRFATFLSTKLSDPAVIATLDDIGQGLGDAAMGALDFIETIDFKAIGEGLTIAKDAAKTIVDTFLSLPPWVQTAIVTGWGLNKVTGGLITDLASGLIKGVLGMNAGVVNINAGVVNGGGIPGAGGKGGSGMLGKAAAIGGGLLAGGVVIAASKIVTDSIDPGFDQRLAGGDRPLANRDPRRFDSNGRVIANWLSQVEGNTDQTASKISLIDPALSAVKAAVGGVLGATQAGANATANATSIASRENQAAINTSAAQTQTQIAAQTASQALASATQVMTTVSQGMQAVSAAGRVEGATRGVSPPIVNSLVSGFAGLRATIWQARPVINATTVNRTTTVNNRYGPSGGSGYTQRINGAG